MKAINPTANPNKKVSKKSVGCLIFAIIFILIIAVIAINDEPLKGQKLFEAKFSPYDGSFSPLVQAVKKQLNDPNSFEHIQTRYFYNQQPNRCLIWMDYKAKNGFGGYTKSEAQCYADSSGNLIEVTEFGRPDQ